MKQMLAKVPVGVDKIGVLCSTLHSSFAERSCYKAWLTVVFISKSKKFKGLSVRCFKALLKTCVDFHKILVTNLHEVFR